MADNTTDTLRDELMRALRYGIAVDARDLARVGPSGMSDIITAEANALIDAHTARAVAEAVARAERDRTEATDDDRSAARLGRLMASSAEQLLAAEKAATARVLAQRDRAERWFAVAGRLRGDLNVERAKVADLQRRLDLVVDATIDEYAAEKTRADHVPDPCPECAAGKCRNCDGRTWNNHLDLLDDCPCAHGVT